MALRRALACFLQLEAPYDAARVEVLLACAYGKQGNAESAEVEFARAREIFQKLGAVPDLARLEALARKKALSPAGPLSPREVQVVQLVASGVTNREIAEKLKISEKTVARHLSNIFNKLDLSSRAAVTAYVYQHRLI